jgi:hypothetical protein
LQITSVNLSDTGIYSCVVDINGSESEASERLRVYVPMVTYPMPITVARVGANTTLKCDGKNYEEIDWWRWRDKVMIKPGKTGFLRFQKTDSGSKLHIRDVTMKDNGSYVCQFFASSQTTIRTVELVVQDTIMSPTNSVNTIIGTSYHSTNIHV